MRRPTDTIDVVDPTGAIYTAIYGNLNIVVMDYEAPAVEPVATGTWTDVYYSELDNYTVFEDTEASFLSTVSAGDLIQPDLAEPDTWLVVATVLSDTELAVDGDVSLASAPLIPYEVRPAIWSYASGVSTYTNPNANFESWMLGWLFTPDVNEPCYLQIIEVTSATSIKVKGDARGLSNPDDEWRIHAPPGVDNTTGGLHTDLTQAGSRYLYGQMRYMPPQAGFDISGTIYGAQLGINKSGFIAVNSSVTDPSTVSVLAQRDGADATSGMFTVLGPRPQRAWRPELFNDDDWEVGPHAGGPPGTGGLGVKITKPGKKGSSSLAGGISFPRPTLPTGGQPIRPGDLIDPLRHPGGYITFSTDDPEVLELVLRVLFFIPFGLLEVLFGDHSDNPKFASYYRRRKKECKEGCANFAGIARHDAVTVYQATVSACSGSPVGEANCTQLALTKLTEEISQIDDAEAACKKQCWKYWDAKFDKALGRPNDDLP